MNSIEEIVAHEFESTYETKYHSITALSTTKFFCMYKYIYGKTHYLRYAIITLDTDDYTITSSVTAANSSNGTFYDMDSIYLNENSSYYYIVISYALGTGTADVLHTHLLKIAISTGTITDIDSVIFSSASGNVNGASLAKVTNNCVVLAYHYESTGRIAVFSINSTYTLLVDEEDDEHTNIGGDHNAIVAVRTVSTYVFRFLLAYYKSSGEGNLKVLDISSSSYSITAIDTHVYTSTTNAYYPSLVHINDSNFGLVYNTSTTSGTLYRIPITVNTAGTIANGTRITTAYTSQRSSIIINGTYILICYTGPSLDGYALLCNTSLTSIALLEFNTSNSTYPSLAPSVTDKFMLAHYGTDGEVVLFGEESFKISIDDEWNRVRAGKISIGSAWKTIVAVKQSIGGTWEDVTLNE